MVQEFTPSNNWGTYLMSQTRSAIHRLRQAERDRLVGLVFLRGSNLVHIFGRVFIEIGAAVFTAELNFLAVMDENDRLAHGTELFT